jgi:hypothetical protein
VDKLGCIGKELGHSYLFHVNAERGNERGEQKKIVSIPNLSGKKTVFSLVFSSM